MKMKRYARLVGIAAGRRALLSMLAAALIVAATVSGASVEAQSADRVNVSLKAPEGDFTVGDPIPLTLEATYPSGFQVILPSLAGSWGPLKYGRSRPPW